MTRGRFVVVEGGDGSGKSTQAVLLAQWLRTQGIDVVETFEPGSGAAGAVIRELVLHSPEAMAPATEALLMAADRAEHVATVIVPACDRGEWVVCDRYLPSSLVYQGIVRRLGVDAVEAVNSLAIDGVAPDLVLVLDVDDSTADARRRHDHDRLEREGAEFHSEVRRAYRHLADERGWAVVDGAGDAEAVAERIQALVAPLLAGWSG